MSKKNIILFIASQLFMLFVFGISIALFLVVLLYLPLLWLKAILSMIIVIFIEIALVIEIMLISGFVDCKEIKK